MADDTITVLVKRGSRGGTRVVARYVAPFEPRRTIRGSTIGWATVEAEDITLRFPAIVERASGRVVFVRDWQAPDWIGRDGADPVDLADPENVAEMLRTGAGMFVTPPGDATDMAKPFAR